MSVLGTIVEYKRFAVHDGDGIRTTLFLKGCPLSCVWCHNPESIAYKSQLAYITHKCIECGECAVCPSGAHTFGSGGHRFSRKMCTSCGKCADVCLGEALTLYGKTVSSKEAAEILLTDKDFFLASGGGVTLSGGEPLMQPEFCADVFKRVKKADISTALDTCGYAPREALETVLPFTDKVLFDIKAARSETHQKFTGKPNLLILDNLKYINSLDIPVEIRIPLVPGVNNGEISEIGAMLAPLKAITAVKVLAYHGYAVSKYESLGLSYSGGVFTPPTKDILYEAGQKLSAFGLNVILPD